MYLKEVNFKAFSTFFHEIATSVPGKKHIVMENSVQLFIFIEIC